MGNAILYRMPSGIPGAITRADGAIVETGLMDTTDYPTAYGVPLVLDSTSKKFRKVKSGDTAASVTGFLVRPYPTGGSTDGLGTSTPPASGIIDVMRRGYINVLCKQGTAAKGGKVYVRLVADTGKAIGDIEAAYEGAITGSTITGTGTGTIGSLTVSESALAGTYRVTLTATGSTAAFSVSDPNGDALKSGNVGTAYSAGGIGFTITNGGTMTSGDYFTVTVAHNTAALTGTLFQGPADADTNTEIFFRL